MRFALGFRGIALACVVAAMTTGRLNASEPKTPRSARDQKVEVPNWASWRGPSGQGYSDDARIPLTWGNVHNLLWKTNLPGQGNSTPIVWGNRIFLTASSDDGKDRLLLCVRTTDGQLLWQRLVAHEDDPGKSHPWNRYASASCTTDGERVYAFFGTPGLFCYDFDGRLVWRHTFGLFTSEAGWGTAASPFLFEDLVIQNCDNDGPRAACRRAMLPRKRRPWPLSLSTSGLARSAGRRGETRDEASALRTSWPCPMDDKTWSSMDPWAFGPTIRPPARRFGTATVGPMINRAASASRSPSRTPRQCSRRLEGPAHSKQFGWAARAT